MPIEKLRPAFTFTEDRLAELRAVLPEAFADGAVNWEALREALGAYLEDEGRDAEHFGLTWPGKRQARRLAAQPSKGTLIPAAGEGVDEATTRNLFIEGDNLEVLKLLQKSYAGRVKLIYIDPPYNTGSDFVYKDDYSEPLEEYLRKTAQVDEQGQIIVSAVKRTGRLHSKWLSMLYPRLVLARNLLSEDGIIFISIDDNELGNLILLMNEIFGEENFLANVIWEKVYSPRMDTEGFSVSHDYILIYGRSEQAIPYQEVFEQNARQFSFYDERKGKHYRRRSVRKEGKDSLRSDVPSMYFPLEAPDGTLVYPIKPDGTEGRWRWSRKKYETELTLDNVEWVKVDGVWQLYAKQYFESGSTKPPVTLWLHSVVGHNHEANMEIANLLGPRVFDTPKPTRLIKKILQIGTNSNEETLVLDFFAGSCTTAHAVVDQNRKDGGRRCFICVQIPETIEHPEYATVAEIGKERIRRVIKRMKQEAKSKLDLQDRDTPEDLGFRVYKLGRSNYKAWQDYQGESVEELETFFDRIETPLVDGWQREHVLAEVILLQGFPLDSMVTDEQGFKRNRIQRVESDAVGHRLFVCLDDQIVDETIAQIQLAAEDIFICLDSALTDEAKLRLSDRCTLRVI